MAGVAEGNCFMTKNNKKNDEYGPAGEGNDSQKNCFCGSGKWIIIILAVAVAAVLIARQAKESETGTAKEPVTSVKTEQVLPGPKTETAGAEKNAPTPDLNKSLPLLVDLGAKKCIPCKMMVPILEGLKKSHTDKFEVKFIDVWENKAEARKYNIRMIPTQIFFAPDGKELFRHEGFYGKENILAKWKELGF